MKWRAYCVFLCMVEARFIFTEIQKDKTETPSDYLLKPNKHDPPKSLCETKKFSSLIEHFFNIIFSEFHNPRPVCVCVQMCPDKATYCYPNDCFKSNKKNKDLPASKINDNLNPIFFVDEKFDFMSGLLEPKSDDVINKLAKPIPETFQEKYRSLFKFKKLPPKVGYKYNRGDQTRNPKRFHQNVDVSKTRWPVNKMSRNLNGRSIQMLPPVGSLKFFNSMLSTKEEKFKKFPLKFYKRDLFSNRTHDKIDDSDNATDISDIEHNIFSLEKLIDSLVEDDVTPNNTLADFISETDDADIKLIKRTTEAYTDDILEYNDTHVISMNNISENIDKNKNIESNKNYNETDIMMYKDLIAKLSKRIDDQTNTSLAMARNTTEDYVFEFDSNKPLEVTPASIHTTQVKTTTAIVSGTYIEKLRTIKETTLPIKLTTHANLDTTEANPGTTQANKTTTRPIPISTTIRPLGKRSTKKIKQLQKRRPNNKNN